MFIMKNVTNMQFIIKYVYIIADLKIQNWNEIKWKMNLVHYLFECKYLLFLIIYYIVNMIYYIVVSHLNVLLHSSIYCRN